MGQTSRIVTIIEGVQVIEAKTHDPDGDPIEAYYLAPGEKQKSLKQAREAAGSETPLGRSACISFP
jgi:hypothetical protein